MRQAIALIAVCQLFIIVLLLSIFMLLSISKRVCDPPLLDPLPVVQRLMV